MATLRGTSSPAVLKMDANKKNDGFYDCGSLPDLLDVAAPRYTHHALRTARLGGTCNKSTTLKIRCETNVQPNFMIAAQSTARKFLRSWRLAGPPARSAATDEPLGLLPQLYH